MRGMNYVMLLAGLGLRRWHDGYDVEHNSYNIAEYLASVYGCSRELGWVNGKNTHGHRPIKRATKTR